MKYPSFDLYQPFKNVKFILSLQALKNWEWALLGCWQAPCNKAKDLGLSTLVTSNFPLSTLYFAFCLFLIWFFSLMSGFISLSLCLLFVKDAFVQIVQKTSQSENKCSVLEFSFTVMLYCGTKKNLGTYQMWPWQDFVRVT